MFKISKYYSRLFVLVCSFIFILFTTKADQQPRGQIALITEINHPYLYYKEGTKELTGIAYDMVMELMKRADIKYELKVLPWLRALRVLDNTDNSCLFIMNRTAERELKYQWVGPLVIGGIGIYKKPLSSIEITSLKDLKNYVVVGKEDSVSIKYLKDIFDAEVIKASSDEQAIKLLYHGRAQLWAAGIIDGPLAAKYLGLPKPEIAFKRGITDLSMGCSLNISPIQYKKLLKAYDSMEDFRKAVMKRYSL